MEMHPLFLLILLLLLKTPLLQLTPAATSAAAAPVDSKAIQKYKQFIRKSCNSTPYPDICYDSLSKSAGAILDSPLNLAVIGTHLAGTKLTPATVYIDNLYRSKIYASLKQCSDDLQDGYWKLWKASGLLFTQKSPVDIIAVEGWVNVGLKEEESCLDYLEGIGDLKVKTDLIGLATVAREFTENAVALIQLYVRTKGD